MSGYDCRESSDNFGNPTRRDRDTIARLTAERDAALARAEKAEALVAELKDWVRNALGELQRDSSALRERAGPLISAPVPSLNVVVRWADAEPRHGKEGGA